MDLKEFYQKIEGDYDGVLSRLVKESLIERFVGKFLQDKSFEELCKYMKDNDIDEAFRAVHTLKGVAVNLGFSKLYKVSSILTEALRNKEIDGVEDMFLAVEKEYKYTIDAINELVN